MVKSWKVVSEASPATKASIETCSGDEFHMQHPEGQGQTNSGVTDNKRSMVITTNGVNKPGYPTNEEPCTTAFWLHAAGELRRRRLRGQEAESAKILNPKIQKSYATLFAIPPAKMTPRRQNTHSAGNRSQRGPMALW